MRKIFEIRPSLNEFIVFFNDNVKNIRPNLLIRKHDLFHKNNCDVFIIQLAKKDMIVGVISQDSGSISQVALIRENDGTSRSKFEFMIGVSLLIETLRPKTEMKRKSKLFEELNFFNKEIDLYNTTSTTKYEGYRCTIYSSTEVGFFSICVTL